MIKSSQSNYYLLEIIEYQTNEEFIYWMLRSNLFSTFMRAKIEFFLSFISITFLDYCSWLTDPVIHTVNFSVVFVVT